MDAVYFARPDLRQGASMIGAARLLLSTVVLLAPVLVLADEATDAFNQLYGDDFKKALASHDPAVGAALAKQLLDAADKAEKQPEFLAILCEKAYELTAKDASGYPTATAAMDLLGEKVPEKKIECLQKCASLYQKQYATARLDAKAKAGEAFIERLKAVADAQAAGQDLDGAGATLRQAISVAAAIKSESKAALQAQLESLAPQQKTERQIAALKAKLDAKADDAASRKELVRLLLVEEDNPAEAAKFLDDSLDEATRKYVPAATKPLEEVPELACKELGEWYRGLADQAAAPMGKGAMLRHAQGYYARFLDTHTDEDLARTTATLTLKKIEDALAKLPAVKTPSAPAAWTDCLKLVDPRRDAIKGRWTRKGDVLVCEQAGAVSVAVPVAPPPAYEVQVSFVRVAGGDAITLMLPVGDTTCNLTLSAGRGEAHGLESVRGKWAGDNESSVKPGTLTNGREYVLTVQVSPEGDAASISAMLDGKPLLRWKGPQTAIALHADWQMPNRRFMGLGAFQDAVEFHRMRVRPISGDLKAGDAPTGAAPTKLTADWTDCLKGVDPAKDAVSGKWVLKGGQLLSTDLDSGRRVSLPVVPRQSYEVQITVSRMGNGIFGLCLPVGKGSCALVVGADGGTTHSLENVGGRKAVLARTNAMAPGQEVTVDVKVALRGDQAEITATLEGTPLLTWNGAQALLSTNPDWALPDPGRLGVGTWGLIAAFKRIQIRALPEDAPPPSRERAPDERPAPRPRG